MNFVKKNIKCIIAIIVCITIASAASVYATATYLASQVEYKDGKSVEEALNELYKIQDNTTTDNIKYLYWKGNEYVNITGGWESTLVFDKWSATNGTQTTKKNAEKKMDYIDLSTNSTMQNCVINTKNKINLSGYNYISIYYTMTRTYFTCLDVTSNLSSGNYPAFDNANAGSSVSFRTILGNDNRLHILTIPINSADEGYITLHTLRGASDDTTTDLKLYGIYLSKTIEP